MLKNLEVVFVVMYKIFFGRSYNLWNEMDEFLKDGGHIDKCPDVVGKTAVWTAEILLDEIKK